MCLSLYVSALLNSCISHTTHEQLWITLLRKTTHPVSPKVNYPEKWEHQQIINAFHRYCRNIRYLVPINIQIVQQTKTIFSHIMQSNKMDDNSTHIIHAHRPMLIVTQRPN